MSDEILDEDEGKLESSKRKEFFHYKTDNAEISVDLETGEEEVVDEW